MENNKPYQALLQTGPGRALYELIEHEGGIPAVIAKLGVKWHDLNNWVHILKHVSAEGAQLIGERIGGRFTREFMRPDITNWEAALRPKRNLVEECRKTSKGRALIAIIQKAGGRTELARRMGVQKEAVDSWLCRGSVPAYLAIKVADELGMDVASVRPDKFEGVVP